MNKTVALLAGLGLAAALGAAPAAQAEGCRQAEAGEQRHCFVHARFLPVFFSLPQRRRPIR